MVSARKLRSAARQLLVGSRGPRRYLSPGLDLEGFFDALRQHGASYVVLRWFEELPHVDPGEDVDLLVADEDLAFVHSLMTRRRPLRRTQKFDVYSVSGLPGADFGGIPYYAPRFARSVLEGGEWLNGRYRVPALRHHYQSLAYHAVYHKGYASGLADGVDADRVPQRTDHDYAAVLADLSLRLGSPLHPTLDSLDHHLGEADLRPPLDTLERLAPRNPWIRERFFSDEPEVDDVWRGLAVFVLRERAADRVEEVVDELDRRGFEVLDVVELDAVQREAAGHRLRGGNWERGPWAVNGGPPAAYVVAYDVAPWLEQDDTRLANRRVAHAKAKVRERLLSGLGAAALYNPVHSSDNPAQALDYLRALGDAGVEERLRELAAELAAATAFPFPVVQLLPSAGRRAQVAVVDHPVHGASVCKVFRPSAQRFLQRELRARRELADVPEVPSLLDSGESWFVTPTYDDDGRHVRRHLPGSPEVQLRPAAARALATFALRLHERGFFLLDLSSHNLMSDPGAGLKVLDLEFLQEYTGDVPDAQDAYTLRGLPDLEHGYDVPLPTGLSHGQRNSAFHQAVTGSAVDALLAPPTPAGQLRSAAVQLVWWVAFGLRRQGTRAGSSPVVAGWSRDVQTLSRHLARRRARARGVPAPR